MITDVFLNQKRVNACKHTTKMASLESFWKVPPFKNSLVMPPLLCVHMHHSLLIEKEVCDRQNISNKFVCAFPSEISSILGKSFPFFVFSKTWGSPSATRSHVYTQKHKGVLIFLDTVWWILSADHLLQDDFFILTDDGKPPHYWNSLIKWFLVWTKHLGCGRSGGETIFIKQTVCACYHVGLYNQLVCHGKHKESDLWTMACVHIFFIIEQS